MSATGDLLSATEQAVCLKQIDVLLQAVASVGGALVSSVDGFEVAARLPASLSSATLSAMTSSQLALGHAISESTGFGACRNVVIEAGSGRVLMMDIPNRHRPLLLTVLCDDGETLGQVLWAARECVAEIGRLLDIARAA